MSVIFVNKTQLCALMGISVKEMDGLVADGELPGQSPEGTWPWSTVDRRVFIDPEERGTVYFIESGAYIKIGFSTDPNRRINGIAKSLPEPTRRLHLMKGIRDTETDMHRKFKKLRAGGEWFRKETELLDFIETLKNEGRT